MTGRHAYRFGQFGPTWAMRPEEITIAEVLKEHGYATAHFGKWHLGPVKASAPNCPGNQGFDQWLSHDNHFEIDPMLSRNGAEPEVIKGESSEILIREAIQFINESVAKEQPFFTVVWFGSCHGPQIALEKDKQLYADVDHKDAKMREKLANRWGEITAIDRSMGWLRDALRERKIADNTVLWYCSDNGEPDNSWYKPKLNGCKSNLFEGGVRVPGIIEWPARIPKPAHSNIHAVTSDMLPTICDIVDIPLPNRVLDGISLLPALEGQMSERPSPICFWHYNQDPEWKNERWMSAESQLGTTLVSGDVLTEFRNFKHPVAKTKDFGGDAAILDNRYKLLIDTSGRHKDKKRTLTPLKDNVALFDLDKDPAESINIAVENPEIVAAMTKQLHRWQASVEQSLTGKEYEQVLTDGDEPVAKQVSRTRQSLVD